MNLIPVHDPEDPRLAGYRDIREKDLVGRQGRFIAEGKVVLRTMLQARRFEVESALILDSRLAGVGDILSGIPDHLPVYVAGRPVLDRVAGFPMHRGVLAIGRRRQAETPASLLAALPPRALVVVLVAIANHDNVGAVFRNAAAFGADAVLLDGLSCDPLYRKAIRVSVGAALKVPFATSETADALADALSEAGFGIVALSPSGGGDIRSVSRPDRVALFLGSEGDGLPPQLLSRLQSARIAMAPGFDSLNVAAASAIALHRLADL
ncbi:MAG: RNA methyltransferase [Rhizobiaceae bacterium]|nr:RNA methyltransferase [Rhizobiaceae bacterium]